MSKRCAKCEKTVYPTEELKCLDKVWHKGCFKCWECGMTLNMKNYKGYEKKPYCNAHYPKTKATAVAETPEQARIKANTKLQSQVKYHEDFEKNFKGTKISVSEDPELARIKQNTQNSSEIEYRGLRQKASEMETKRPLLPPGRAGGGSSYQAPPGPPPPLSPTEAAPSPYSAGRGQTTTTMYTQEGKVQGGGQRRVGSISDYDPMNNQWGSIGGGYQPVGGGNQRQQWEETVPAPQPPSQPQPPPPQAQPPPQQEPEPVHHSYQPPPQPYHAPPPEPEPVSPPVPHTDNAYQGLVFQAMYDYDAADDDEVGFRDGDLIVECQPIDDGWMYGKVKRTGQVGMLPANYVEKVS